MAVKTIRIPKTPPQAFNKQRPVSNLLKAHIANLETAVYGPAAAPKRPRSEGQASAYIETLTKQLHPDAAASSPGATEARRLLQAEALGQKRTPKPAPRVSIKRRRRAGAKKR